MRGTDFVVAQGLQATVTLPVLLIGVIGILLAICLHQKKRMKDLQYLLITKKEQEKANRECMIAAGFFNNILEADITRNRLIGTGSLKLIGILGLSKTASYSACIDAILKKMINREYQALYRASFDRQNLLNKFEAGEHIFSIEFLEKSDLIHECWTRATVCLYYAKASKTVRLISYVNDIQRDIQKELGQKYLINTDHLTGILNKRATEERIHSILTTETGGTRHHALLVIDIDYFKQINDTIGHTGGDNALCKVASLFERHFRADDIVGRVGGDEFTILIKDCGREASVIERVERLAAQVASKEVADEVGMHLSLSIGIAFYPEHGTNYQELFKAADQALYFVKEHNRNGYYIYHQSKNFTLFEPK